MNFEIRDAVGSTLHSQEWNDIDQTTGAGWDHSRTNIRGTTMPDESRRHKQPPLELTTDFLGENRHEFVAKLAYKLWEQRGRPLGSPKATVSTGRAVYFGDVDTPKSLKPSSRLVWVSSGMKSAETVRTIVDCLEFGGPTRI
jgi:hypothetical protein